MAVLVGVMSESTALPKADVGAGKLAARFAQCGAGWDGRCQAGAVRVAQGGNLLTSPAIGLSSGQA